MKTAPVWIVALMSIATIHPNAANGMPPPPADVAAASNAFAADLYGKLAAQPGNLFCSPHSIHAALALTGGGARGETAAQMARVMGWNDINDQAHAAYATLFTALNAKPKPGEPAPHTLSVANALFAQQDFPFRPDYLQLARTQYQAGMFNVDFATRTEPTRLEINTWVSKQTQNKINDLVAPGVLNSQTRMVLVNAIYFKGSWLTAFPKDATRREPFHVTADKSVDAEMMHLTKRFGYRETAEAQVLELPYRGHQLSMFVLLPKAQDGWPAFEKTVSANLLRDLTARAPAQEVVVSLPRFKMTREFSLADSLGALGMTDAFAAGKADFSGMSDKADLFLQAVMHKAFVEVNEEGTEAAAATGMAMGVTSVMEPKPPVVFRADHPFLFVIRHNPTGVILFLGRLTDPSA
jgi:serpin B